MWPTQKKICLYLSAETWKSWVNVWIYSKASFKKTVCLWWQCLSRCTSFLFYINIIWSHPISVSLLSVFTLVDGQTKKYQLTFHELFCRHPQSPRDYFSWLSWFPGIFFWVPPLDHVGLSMKYLNKYSRTAMKLWILLVLFPEDEFHLVLQLVQYLKH